MDAQRNECIKKKNFFCLFNMKWELWPACTFDVFHVRRTVRVVNIPRELNDHSRLRDDEATRVPWPIRVIWWFTDCQRATVNIPSFSKLTYCLLISGLWRVIDILYKVMFWLDWRNYLYGVSSEETSGLEKFHLNGLKEYQSGLLDTYTLRPPIHQRSSSTTLPCWFCLLLVICVEFLPTSHRHLTARGVLTILRELAVPWDTRHRSQSQMFIAQKCDIKQVLKPLRSYHSTCLEGRGNDTRKPNQDIV